MVASLLLSHLVFTMNARRIMIISVLLLIGVFLFPIWRITLDAPQFPGGLQLYIWVDKFSGAEGGGDIIKNINILNHYIGMQYIEPDSIPELKYFPIILYVMMGYGLLVALINKGWAYLSWIGTMAVLGIIGIYDFYLWLYDYGHNLDPAAPIKIPGMVYMPPLIGEKDLLNFYVTSYPNIGSLFLGLSVVLAMYAWYRKKNEQKFGLTA